MDNFIKSNLRDNYCLEIKDNSVDNGAKIHGWDCNNNNNQYFVFNQNTNQIISKHSDKCLNFNAEIGEGALLNQFDCLDSTAPNFNNQTFKIEGNNIKSLYNPNLCVDMQWSNKTNGTKAWMQKCNGSYAQSWNVVPNITGNNAISMQNFSALDLPKI